jgi:hypothetical protein
MICEFACWSGLPPADVVMQSLLEEWTLHPLVVNGEIRAIAAMSGSEIHFAIAPQWRHRTITRRRTREFLGPLFEAHGFLTTRAEPDQQHDRFLTRIGFDKTYHDGRFDHYMMTALPFERN